MKKVLGLDLGSSSIGWALIDKDTNKILGLGSRIIPYNGAESQDFAKGTGESRNSLRTKARTARKGYDRYQLRRKYLVDVLIENNMMPDDNLKKLPKMQLWELRNKAVISNISKQELGRLLLWLNQKRGYKSSRSDANLGKKDTEYVKDVKNRFDKIKDLGFTIGQYFHSELKKDEYFRVKENIFPREAYIEEYDIICARQKDNLGLTDELIAKIRNEVIYYQRPLKSQKGLVSVCEFEGFWTKDKNNKEVFVGPKAAPKSSPLFQIAKIWENINNIKLSSKLGETLELTLEEKQKIFEYLDNNPKLTATDLFKILGKRRNEFTVTKQIEKGIQGNITKNEILRILDKNEAYNSLLRFDLNIIETDKFGYLYSRKTGEVLGEKSVKYIDPIVENEPFYQLWHTIYSINDVQECSNALQKRFGIDLDTANKLSTIDFNKYAFGNKSAKAIRNILPYLMEGDKYSDAMSYAGYDHSNSLTKDENLERKLLDKLKPIEKNSLRQPIVEKILNQMVNVVNAIIEKYGKPDEIRIELARELKQGKEERSNTDNAIRKRQRENESIKKRLSEYGLRATRNNIIKWRLYEEIDNHDKKLNAICIYCGQPISITEAINGNEVDIEHIIPKSKLFDDSQSNKTLAHRRCNSKKNDMTAYDFMKTKSQEEFDAYVDRVNSLFANKIISKTKRDKLLMSEDKIPDNFIERQLRESQYIARKAREILQTICYDVWSTSGIVTAELRRLWGWDDVTMKLQMPKYKELGLTEMKEWESEHGKRKHTKEIIKDWTKRDDHRHHAVDALVIACTDQGFIQRFNTLNSSKTREDMYKEVEQRSGQYKEKLSLLEKYIISKCPIAIVDIEKAVANILISFKSGKKVAVFGKRKIGKQGNKKVVQAGIVVPRGALSEDSIYGKIKTIERNKTLKYLFENTQLIVDSHIRHLVEQRLEEFGKDQKKALASLKKDPIYLDVEKSKSLEYAACFKDEYVIKYTVDINFNKVDKVIDGKIKEILQNRLNKFGGKAKEAFKDVQHGEDSLRWYEDEGLERPIHSVRCFTGLSAVVPVKKDEDGNEIGFVKPGNNHHIAIYSDKEGNKSEHVCTFWHAVERKKYGIPIIIEGTNEIWDKILSAKEGFYPQSFLEQLPPPNLDLSLSMQQNEMFILGMAEEDIKNTIEKADYGQISKYLYRVQKLSTANYMFRHHLETQIIDDENSKKSKRFQNVRSIGALFLLNPFKVKIDCLGNVKPPLP
ncbi:type II CRISPR RNA-guided endonuclease Cas9 [Dysgonomonas sp. 511]|uniref:type II CRISPR RNA-guided endonuclease Cas9 n=1 Tax=Dysgonomonas sp. 511 TaxID=2302930 RepID=UPI0013D45411|nr:type II CRISPR RNA-guided endonuclease Cas9 [Dysgonomonas sp. 511]NDV79794.1 type II CRISPR RNA-guided endonuclease Cas9 [Dysgonomonas sp. 511]